MIVINPGRVILKYSQSTADLNSLNSSDPDVIGRSHSAWTAWNCIWGRPSSRHVRRLHCSQKQPVCFSSTFSPVFLCRAGSCRRRQFKPRRCGTSSAAPQRPLGATRFLLQKAGQRPDCVQPSSHRLLACVPGHLRPSSHPPQRQFPLSPVAASTLWGWWHLNFSARR